MAKILLVDDDKEIANIVSSMLSKLDEHILDVAYDGQQASFLLKLNQYDLVILDWTLPESPQGDELLTDYRKNGGKAPVLMLTGKLDVASKISCFDAGVDDYVTKPFNAQELVARIRALLRRSVNPSTEILQTSDIELDLRTMEVRKKGQKVELFQREFALLEFLFKHKGRYFKSQELLNRVWSCESEASPDAVRQCISRLRAKLDNSGEPSIIQTVQGLGYRVRDI